MRDADEKADLAASGEVLQPRLMAGIIHEFNNMQACAVGRLELVLNSGALDGRDARLLREAEDALDRGRRVAELILELASGRVLGKRLVLAEVPIRRALAMLEPELAWCGAEVSLDLSGEACWLNEDLVTHAAGNLISNALREVSGGDCKRIEVHCRTDGQRMELRVADSGRGFLPEHLEELKRPLQEYCVGGGVGGRWNHRKRFGFGLFLTRWIALVHGGAVTFENRETGGALCTFCLPTDCNEPDRRASQPGKREMAAGERGCE